MHKNVMIYTELKELNSWLADVSNKNVFTVPDAYFDSLSADILQSISNLNPMNEFDIPVLNMQVPDGYFDELAEEIMNKIKAHDIETSLEQDYPPFLAAIRHQNVFKVPDGYFDNVAKNILNKLQQQPAKVVDMKPRRSFFKYAVAAAMTGVIGLSVFSTFNKKNIGNIEPGFSFTIIKTGNEILKNNSFDKMMEALNEDEIVNYLKNDGEDVNAALVASLMDEQSLPNEDAYFFDEKVLDNFLKENIGERSNN
jgi:hypothetical protein